MWQRTSSTKDSAVIAVDGLVSLISRTCAHNANAPGKDFRRGAWSSLQHPHRTNTKYLMRGFLPVVRGGSDVPGRAVFSATTSSPKQNVASSVTRFSKDEKQASRQEAKEQLDAFLTRDSRQKFIGRVYAILTGQLLVTVLSILTFGLNPKLTWWIMNQAPIVPILSLGLSTVAWIFMCASERARRESPLKWRLLIIFTIGEALSVGFLSSFFTLRSVVSAMTTTAVATLSITLYTLLQKNPKYDLSQWGSGLLSMGIIFLVYGLIHILEVTGVLPAGFLPYSDMIYSVFGAGLFSVYLAHHTRLIVSGKNTKFQMNEKDYVFGAMSLYNDIINIFIYLLRILGEERNN
eukprot:CAMPEP_0198285350 /NCGR_PEP_ID=MMETSP1449-20131203/4671_1 /TAXON_ID=420275 /ORGANISM="Attheya septentrionalis, Strain CCMP2084" /LENGTH=348 /DNA_ID=CAMNT_0043982755 /DNA_START=156 /DNA_END=1203 /DNA_ORIENTATION=-